MFVNRLIFLFLFNLNLHIQSPIFVIFKFFVKLFHYFMNFIFVLLLLNIFYRNSFIPVMNLYSFDISTYMSRLDSFNFIFYTLVILLIFIHYFFNKFKLFIVTLISNHFFILILVNYYYIFHYFGFLIFEIGEFYALKK